MKKNNCIYLFLALLFSIFFYATMSVAKLEVAPGKDSTQNSEKTKVVKQNREKKELALGTASVAGVFYPVGQGICRLINDSSSNSTIQCFAYSTNGSEYNIRAIINKELDLAISRADLIYEAYKGFGKFKRDGSNHGINIISPLYGMPLSIITKKSKDITTIYDLKGKRLNIGNPGSGKRTVSDLLFKTAGWSKKDFKRLTALSTVEMGNAFCKGGVDVIIELLGMPAAFYHRVTHECGGQFIDIPVGLVHKIKRDNPFIRNAIISGGRYPNNPNSINTFQIDAVLICPKRLDTSIVYEITRTIFHDISKFKNIHPALWDFNPIDLIKGEQNVPFHAGALKYFKEQGWR